MNSLPKQCDFDEFKKRYDSGRAQVLWRFLPADLDTPVGAYLKLCDGGDKENSFLFESVESGENIGRYCLIGLDPDLIWKCENDTPKIKAGNGEWVDDTVSPIESLRSVLSKSAIKDLSDGLPPMAGGGLFGMLGYGVIRWVEDIPQGNPDTLGLPQACLMRPSILVIFDTLMHRMCLLAPSYKAENIDAKKAFDDAQKRLDNACASLKLPAPECGEKSSLKAPVAIESDTTEDEYKDAVLKAKEHIYAGDIFQVVLSRRFFVPFDLPAFSLYRKLRALNPSPFLFHITFDGWSLVGSSPETLVRIRDGQVMVRPLAGTRPRGKDKARDLTLERDLLADKKELAEHLMLLDLGRNDVGRVSKIGTMDVPDRFVVERYSHVMHISSTVTGQLRDDCDAIDALLAGFPVGTVSGAPKIRAMEIIDDLEPLERSFYAGGVGYFGADGGLDTCIALRTGLVKDGRLYIQAGAGIVAHSDPQAEYEETAHKARALLTAANMAISG